MDDYAGATGAVGEAFRALGVRAAIGVPIIVEGRLWGAMGAAATAPLSPGAESRMGEFTALVATAIANIDARTEITASRTRIVAAADDERRRVVRDLHDGAQQRLVHTVITLKLAKQALVDGGDDAASLVSEALENAQRANEELRELAHGILPAALTRGGLRAGLETLASRMPVPIEIEVAADRLPAPIEATAYFVVAEALTNVAKHAHAETPRSPRGSRTGRSGSRCATTASAASARRGAASKASRTASPRSTAGSRSRARPPGGRWSPPPSPSRPALSSTPHLLGTTTSARRNHTDCAWISPAGGGRS